MVQVKIKENSWFAQIAARKLRCSQVAMVVGKTIHLHNSSKEDFLNNKRWVRHEIAHVQQYAELGLFKFLVLYLLESFNKGYEQNRFEVEARQKECDAAILSNIQFL
jgi:Fe-S cluster assembly scaffold protein SufB